MNKHKISGIAALVALIGTGLVAQPTVEAEPALSSETLGMYVGFNRGDRFDEYEKALGAPFGWSVIMAVGKSASEMRGATWGQLISDDAYLPEVSDRLNLVITVPLAFGPGGQARTDSGRETVGANLRDTAAGKWDDDYRAVAANLKKAGYGDAVIRLGHEFDIAWHPHSSLGNEAAYIAAFRHVHDVLASESSGFRFDWTGTHAKFSQYGPAAYPGDAYVDIVGLDIYYSQLDPISDRVWENQYLPALRGHREFARAHGKPVSYPEWGRAFGNTSLFVDRMHSWLSALPVGGPGGLTYHSYFNEARKDYDLTYLPKVRQRYLELFGSSGSVGAPAPAPAAANPEPSPGGLVVELPDPPQTVTPSRGTAVQVTDTLQPPRDQAGPIVTTPPTTAPIVTTPPRPGTAVPVGAITASVEGTATLPSISVVRDVSSLAITYQHDDAKLYNIRHRPAGSEWWKWEVQTKSTTFSIAGIGADTAHVVQVKAYVKGQWRDWNTVTVEPVTTAVRSALEGPAAVSTVSSYLPKIWATRADTALTLNYRRPEAKLYHVRHRPAGSAFWRWEKQTKLTTALLTGLDASRAHEVEVRAYVDGRWRGWNSITVDA